MEVCTPPSVISFEASTGSLGAALGEAQVMSKVKDRSEKVQREGDGDRRAVEGGGRSSH
jgi:hypothetical protein